MADMKKFTEFLDKGASLSEGVYIAPSADVIGDVAIGRDVSVWHNAVIRGDVNNIVIGDRSNVQDCSVLHVNKDQGIIIGKNVTIGHSVNLHGCTIGNNVLVGIGAIILDGAVIEDDCIIAAGSLVPPRKTITSGSMVMGSPAKIMWKLTEKDLEWVKENADHYIDYKNVYIDKGLWYPLKKSYEMFEITGRDNPLPILHMEIELIMFLASWEQKCPHWL